ncbi:MAG: Branched-chain amino acid transport ATP-binding protein LivF (TC 3.A.1.4.1) [uncultured Paraburkholderia sp.]|nr:MAG: Branched-chain amino acid transport ATP-binding protein LivF (TC 3.A.1.4.1) [uncultured Paraburkholderia sp.]CAH2941342.1 MAG: Branched-chain amino acid transport ATP-binding protein LivF (TC 3.A.1.4.1) [uncultured Paraburkholderia sp.]
MSERGRQAMLRFSSIVAGYGDTMVLKGISGEVAAGNVLGVFGRNGVGKSTLMRALTGVIQPTSGAVIVNGSEVGKVPPHQRRHLGMSYAQQERVVFDNLSVADNLTLGFKTRSPQAYDDLFQIFPRLKERLFQPAGKLSGGEKKLLSFARVIAERSPLTLIDEPSEGVQQENLERMASVIRSRIAEGAAFVVVEQNLMFLTSIADNFIGLVSRIRQFVASCVRDRRPCRSIVITARSFWPR